jgi:AraC-like DNA-binding protein
MLLRKKGKVVQQIGNIAFDRSVKNQHFFPPAGLMNSSPYTRCADFPRQRICQQTSSDLRSIETLLRRRRLRTYEPSLLLIPQGKKRVDLGKESYVFGEATFLLTSIELPIVSRVSVASVKKPYLAFFLKLDMGIVRDVLHTEEVRIPAPPAGTRGMVLGEATVELVTPCLRMVHLLLAPQNVPFLGKLLQREIVYRLLQGPQGDRLRSIATTADQSYRTGRAVSWLRKNFEKRLNVNELASMAGMSRSTLHHHFRGLTAMSPLQFQKQLRLHTARQRMLTEDLDAASAAFEVGYESPSQFNREYKHVFGKPPMRDVQALRTSLLS